VVLVNAAFNLTLPYPPSAQLVAVTAFIKKDIAGEQPKDLGLSG
jgi:hypothetical protein